MNRGIGSIMKVEGNLCRVSGSEIEHLVWGLNNANHLWGPGGMLPWEILRLRSSDFARSIYSIHFCIFSVFKEGNQVTPIEALGPSL